MTPETTELLLLFMLPIAYSLIGVVLYYAFLFVILIYREDFARLVYIGDDEEFIKECSVAAARRHKSEYEEDLSYTFSKERKKLHGYTIVEEWNECKSTARKWCVVWPVGLIYVLAIEIWRLLELVFHKYCGFGYRIFRKLLLKKHGEKWSKDALRGDIDGV